MVGDLFAGIRVTDYAEALAWYERLFGSTPSAFTVSFSSGKNDLALAGHSLDALVSTTCVAFGVGTCSETR